MRSICTRSTSTAHSRGSSAVSRTPASSAGIWNCSTRSSTTSHRFSRDFCSTSWPDSACESSSSARTICDRRSISCSALNMASRYCSVVFAGEQRDFELAADRRDGRAQLVGDVGRELPHLLERGFQPLDHAVEGKDQVIQFVARLRAWECAAAGSSRRCAARPAPPRAPA